MTEPQLGRAEARALEDCLAGGGVALFPADTVYGLACDPSCEPAVQRLYAIKRRPRKKPSAVMFFDRELALAELGGLGGRLEDGLRAVLPGPVTVLVPNPSRRFPLACAGDPQTLGLRVPRLPSSLAALAAVRRPLLQSSANLAGGAEAVTLAEVAPDLREAADLVLDGGRLPGVPSTIVDLRRYESEDAWTVIRSGAISREQLDRRLAGAQAQRPGPRKGA